MEIYDALRRAVEHLDTMGWSRTAPYRLTASRPESEWVFWFVFLPETPGRDVTVLVADDGEIRAAAGI